MEDSWLVETIVVLNSKIDKISFVYLSLPIGGSLERLSFWHLLIPSIRKRRFGWKSKNLFMGGRLVLIKYVLHTRMVYFISFFKASIDIIYLIDSFLNLFLWHESEEIWTINLIHWNNFFFFYMEVEGLMISEFNLTLLGKWGLRCMLIKGLWYELLVSKMGLRVVVLKVEVVRRLGGGRTYVVSGRV